MLLKRELTHPVLASELAKLPHSKDDEGKSVFSVKLHPKRLVKSDLKKKQKLNRSLNDNYNSPTEREHFPPAGRKTPAVAAATGVEPGRISRVGQVA
jgi:hypothetical protein